jgi:uncharacterized protein YjbI with pentapeptide repeats
MVSIDLLLVWTLWPSYLREWGGRLVPRWAFSWGMVAKALMALGVLAFSLVVATYPGEAVHIPRLTQSANVLWPYYNRLYLPNEDFSDDAELKRLIAENKDGDNAREVFVLSLAGRDLQGADLSGADLRLTTFRRADICDANFDGAWLQDADLAVVTGAEASFVGAQLRGVRLAEAKLQGARFTYAEMQGVVLAHAQLQGASFGGAQLQGVSLLYAQLQGASMEGTQLQGATLEGAQLDGATLDDVRVWRTVAKDTVIGRVPFDSWDTSKREYTLDRDEGGVRWRKRKEFSTVAAVLRLDHSPGHAHKSKLDFAVWKQDLLETIPQGDYRDAAAIRFAVLDPKAREPAHGLTKAFWDKTQA